ncbi:MAG: DUF5665 domain-containing protein [Patescibacteria group bacterium]
MLTQSIDKKLIKELNNLEKTLSKLNSVKRKLLLGIVHGVGTAIGATVITAIIIYFVVSTLRILGLEGILDAIGLGAILDKQAEIVESTINGMQ